MAKLLLSVTPECYNVIKELQILSNIDTSVFDSCEDPSTTTMIQDKLTSMPNWLKQKSFIPDICKMINGSVLDNFNKKVKLLNISPNVRVLSFQPFCDRKLDGFDKFIGICVNKADYDYAHIAEHEGVSRVDAEKFFDNGNAFIRKNKAKYDVFIENKTIAEIVQIIGEM